MFKSILAAGALALGLAAPMAQAATVTVSGTGQITTVGSAFASQFAVGGAASFEIVYDSEAASVVSGANFATYPFVSATLTFATSAGGTQSINAGSPKFFSIDRADFSSIGLGISESVQLLGSQDQVFASVANSRPQIILRGDGDLLTDLSLPTALDVNDLLFGSFFRVADRLGVDVNLTSDIQTLSVVVDDPSVVPLPAGGLLLISGLGLLAVQRRRSNARAA